MGEIKGWSDQEHMEEFFAYLNSFLMICVPLYTIAGPARAGMYYVLRNWSWESMPRRGISGWNSREAGKPPHFITSFIAADIRLLFLEL